MFDEDGSGTISPEEFRKTMINQGAQMTEEEIDEIMSEADVDGDGQLNIDGTFFYWQLHFSSLPGLSNKVLEIEPASCFTVALFLHVLAVFIEKRPI